MPDSKSQVYRDLAVQLAALLDGETDRIANAANMAALIYHGLSDLSWAGFYLRKGNDLVLGPFQGKPACLRIAIGEGVCGAAAARREAVLVPNVEEFPGHIACDPAARSELVVPLIEDGAVLGVLDLDSPVLARFEDADREGCERLVAVFVAHHRRVCRTPSPRGIGGRERRRDRSAIRRRLTVSEMNERDLAIALAERRLDVALAPATCRRHIASARTLYLRASPCIADAFRELIVHMFGIAPEAANDPGVLDQSLIERLDTYIRGNRQLNWKIVQRGFWVHGVDNLRAYCGSAELFTMQGHADRIRCPTLISQRLHECDAPCRERVVLSAGTGRARRTVWTPAATSERT
ncbi:MAG TPA: GAF domain-containing protein [Stellaceae bacterium]